MPSSKKLPAMTRKKVTASARAKTSPQKRHNTRTVDQSGSYLKASRTVSNKPSSSQGTVSSEASNNDAILAMLHKLDDSNKILAQRVDRVEQRSFTSSPLGQGVHAVNFRRGDLQTSPQAGLNHQATTRGPSSMVTDNLLGHQHHAMEAADRVRLVHQGQEMTRDAVLPTMDNLHRIPTVAEAVNNILASYEA